MEIPPSPLAKELAPAASIWSMKMPADLTSMALYDAGLGNQFNPWEGITKVKPFTAPMFQGGDGESEPLRISGDEYVRALQAWASTGAKSPVGTSITDHQSLFPDDLRHHPIPEGTAIIPVLLAGLTLGLLFRQACRKLR